MGVADLGAFLALLLPGSGALWERPITPPPPARTPGSGWLPRAVLSSMPHLRPRATHNTQGEVQGWFSGEKALSSVHHDPPLGIARTLNPSPQCECIDQNM